MMKIATIIVTFNRKDLLLRSIDAVLRQTYLPTKVYIIDNCSTDGTSDLLLEKGIINESGVYNDIELEYIKLPMNGGGSMGFHEGLRIANESRKFDAFWVMDDDGMPHKDCLKELVVCLSQSDYISPIVADIENKERMAFRDCAIQQFVESQSENGNMIRGAANPFNGILYSKRFIETVGYPEKDMFIWGDEINYDLRGRLLGMPPSIACKAIHYHPRNRAQHSQAFFFGLKKVVFVDCKWKMYCRCCNAIYNYKLGGRFTQIVKEFMLYNWLFGITMHSLSWLKLYNTAFLNGWRGIFGGHKKYMN